MLKSGYVNVPVDGKIEQLHYRYDDEAAAYIFDRDIQIGDWTIKNIVKLGGPRSSIYKYDFKNYLEFVIVDKNEANRTKEWYYHGDCEVNIYGCDGGSHYALECFFSKYPIFKCYDWNDYDASVKLKEIQKILESTDIDNSTKYQRIKSCHSCPVKLRTCY